MMPRQIFALAIVSLAMYVPAASAPAQQSAAPAGAPAAAPAFTPAHITVKAGGTGPDVILIPGLNSPREVWRTELPKILPHYRVHLVQVDGFASAPAGANAGMKAGLLDAIVSDLAQYIEANHLQSPAIIGHSMGGLLGLMLADKHPQDVGKLLIVDSLPYTGAVLGALNEMEARDQANGIRQSLIEATKDQSLKGAVASAQSMVTAKADQDHVALWSANSDRNIEAEAFYEVMTTDLRPDMARISTPITVLWPYTSDGGKESDTLKVYSSQYSKAPHATLVKIDNSKHFIMLDQPVAFDNAVQAFLKS